MPSLADVHEQLLDQVTPSLANIADALEPQCEDELLALGTLLRVAMLIANRTVPSKLLRIARAHNRKLKMKPKTEQVARETLPLLKTLNYALAGRCIEDLTILRAFVNLSLHLINERGDQAAVAAANDIEIDAYLNAIERDKCPSDLRPTLLPTAWVSQPGTLTPLAQLEPV